MVQLITMKKATQTNIDFWFLGAVLVLFVVGLTWVYSASYPSHLNSRFGGELFIKQLILGIVGIVAMLIITMLKTDILRKISWAAYILAGIGLMAVLVVGTAKGGNKSWIDLGPFQFQPTELAKVAIVMMTAAVIARKPSSIKSYRDLLSFGPYLYMGLFAGLILFQRDLGSLVVFGLACFIFMGFSGVKSKFYLVPLAALLILGTIYTLTDHKAGRFKAWFNPFSTSSEVIEYAYQPKNSLIAIGSGGPFGKGFAQSRQKWGYLPEPHNDYILSIISEEMGFFFVIGFVLLPYGIIICRGFTIAERANDTYSALLAGGATIMLTVQAIINMAVVTNTIPCMGITLPFVSYGGTSLICSFMLAGLILNVSNNTNALTSKRFQIYNRQNNRRKEISAQNDV